MYSAVGPRMDVPFNSSSSEETTPDETKSPKKFKIRSPHEIEQAGRRISLHETLLKNPQNQAHRDELERQIQQEKLANLESAYQVNKDSFVDLSSEFHEQTQTIQRLSSEVLVIKRENEEYSKQLIAEKRLREQDMSSYKREKEAAEKALKPSTEALKKEQARYAELQKQANADISILREKLFAARKESETGKREKEVAINALQEQVDALEAEQARSAELEKQSQTYRQQFSEEKKRANTCNEIMEQALKTSEKASESLQSEKERSSKLEKDYTTKYVSLRESKADENAKKEKSRADALEERACSASNASTCS